MRVCKKWQNPIKNIYKKGHDKIFYQFSDQTKKYFGVKIKNVKKEALAKWN